jgi:hypothetical protein
LITACGGDPSGKKPAAADQVEADCSDGADNDDDGVTDCDDLDCRAISIFGLLPVLLDDGVGADVAKRIAAPMWGGLVSLTLLTSLVVPAVYVIWRSFELRRSPVVVIPSA